MEKGLYETLLIIHLDFKLKQEIENVLNDFFSEINNTWCNKKEIKQFTINYIFNTHSFDLIKQLYINRI